MFSSRTPVAALPENKQMNERQNMTTPNDTQSPAINSYHEPRPTRLLKITERFYGRVIYTSQMDIDRANRRGSMMIRCRCLNGKLVSHYNEEMGWHNKADAVFHREYLDGATIEEVEVRL
jgi:hypothetical protein